LTKNKIPSPESKLLCSPFRIRKCLSCPGFKKPNSLFKKEISNKEPKVEIFDGKSATIKYVFLFNLQSSHMYSDYRSYVFRFPGVFITFEKAIAYRQQQVHCFPARSSNSGLDWLKVPCKIFKGHANNQTIAYRKSKNNNYHIFHFNEM